MRRTIIGLSVYRAMLRAVCGSKSRDFCGAGLQLAAGALLPLRRQELGLRLLAGGATGDDILKLS